MRDSPSDRRDKYWKVNAMRMLCIATVIGRSAESNDMTSKKN